MDRSDLTIADVADRTGIPEATLRIWEQRYDFPRPRRLPSGHRRYRERDVEGLKTVLRLRQEGLSLKAATVRVRERMDDDGGSPFRLVRRLTGFEPQRVTKRAMLGMSRAVEDEISTSPGPSCLVGGFQESRRLGAALPRWRDLAHTMRACVAFAELREPPPADLGGIVVLPIEETDGLLREWFVVAMSPDRTMVLSGLALPHDDVAWPERPMEVIWTVDPTVTREAVKLCAGRVDPLRPDLARTLEDVADHPLTDEAGSARMLTALGNRMVAYVDEAARLHNVSGRPRRNRQDTSRGPA